jgi:hypothetical protein
MLFLLQEGSLSLVVGLGIGSEQVDDGTIIGQHYTQ